VSTPLEVADKLYPVDLEELKQAADALPNTRMHVIAKVTALVAMNMRWETIMVDRNFPESPGPHVRRIIRDAQSQLEAWQEASFIEGPSEPLGDVSDAMEDRHHDLFQDLWINFSESEYEDRIARYTHRLEINDLADGFFGGKDVIDFGCGHGNFLHACLRAGATSGLGIDFGEGSIAYAIAARDRLGVGSQQLDFEKASVYDCGRPDSSFDVAIQNGVFHHLDDEDSAYREVHRVLRRGGWLWIYTDGAGGVSHDLWDASVHILKDVPHAAILEVLDFLGVETNKRYHLGDGLNAVYRHASYEDFTARLAGYGFGNVRRLVGGYPTDFDHDVIAQDRFGAEKFGSGDIRVLVQKL
jgi:SAM-dependent methyltransferase